MASDAQLTPMWRSIAASKSELAQGRAAAVPPRRFLRGCFRGCPNRRAVAHVALNKRGVIPMCGIPFHAAKQLHHALLRAGRKVAHLRAARRGRPRQFGSARSRNHQPGTHFDERLLAAERNNFLAAINSAGKLFRPGAGDLTTGSFKCARWKARPRCSRTRTVAPGGNHRPGESASVQKLLQGAFPSSMAMTTGFSRPDGAIHGARSIQGGFARRLRPQDKTAAMGAAGRRCTT